jgi:ribulose 1,5-bisphosphate synthetase/thiazole synthase
MEKTYDVVVVGGGPGGINAAIAAGRLGARTLLIERYGFLGGMSTAGLVYPWMTFHDMQGNQVVRGVAQEIVDRLMARGASPGHLRDTVGVCYTVTPFDKEALKLVAVEMAREASVNLLLHSVASQTDVSGDRVVSVTTTSPYGGREIPGKVFVDATGDCSLVALAGARTVKGRPDDGKVQPMTMMFRVGGVDLEAVKAYVAANPKEFWKDTRIDKLDEWPLSGVSGFFSLWEAHKPPSVPRNLVLFFAGLRPGEVFVNTTRVIDQDPTDVEAVTAAEVEGRRQVWAVLRFLQDHIPGFERSELLETGPQIGVRESRRLRGVATLTTEDIVTGRRFPDVIARNGYQIDIHDPEGRELINKELIRGAYDIPYGALVSIDLSNVVVAGRAISCSVEAFASLRTTPSCMAIGQAAGVAAALAARAGTTLAQVDVGSLQAALREQGAELG